MGFGVYPPPAANVATQSVSAFGFGLIDRRRVCRRLFGCGLSALLVSLGFAMSASADISFIKAWGWGVSDGMGHFEMCTTTCYSGIAGGGAGQFQNPGSVAIDPSGDVYVADAVNYRIDEFSSAGAFIKAYGWGVSDGQSKFETCTSS